MGQLCEIQLEAAAPSVRKARAFVEVTFASWRLHDLSDVAVLLTSELVTNAVVHARTRFCLALHLEASTVTVEVSDTSAEAPQVKDTPVDNERGRGLALVENLAARWGTRQDQGGKTVWFQLARSAGHAEAG